MLGEGEGEGEGERVLTVVAAKCSFLQHFSLFVFLNVIVNIWSGCEGVGRKGHWGHIHTNCVS